MTRFLNDMPGLLLRFVLYFQTMDVDKVLALGLPRIGGCILLDGDVGPRTAALSEPYIDIWLPAVALAKKPVGVR